MDLMRVNLRDKLLGEILPKWTWTALCQGSILKSIVGIGDQDVKGIGQITRSIPFATESEGIVRDLRDSFQKGAAAIIDIGSAKNARTNVIDGLAIGGHGVRNGGHDCVRV